MISHKLISRINLYHIDTTLSLFVTIVYKILKILAIDFGL